MLTSSNYRPSQKRRLGEVLIQLGYLDPARLAGTLEQARSQGVSFGQAAVATGVLTEAQVMAALSRQVGLPYEDLDAPDIDCIALFPAAFVQKHRAVAIERGQVRGGDVVVALAAPARLDTQDAVRAVLATSRVRFVLAADRAIERALHRLYGMAPSSGVAPSVSALRAPTASSVPAAPATPPARVKNDALEVLAALDLSPRTLDVLMREATQQNVTQREVARRALESWASTRRAH